MLLNEKIKLEKFDGVYKMTKSDNHALRCVFQNQICSSKCIGMHVDDSIPEKIRIGFYCGINYDVTVFDKDGNRI